MRQWEEVLARSPRYVQQRETQSGAIYALNEKEQESKGEGTKSSDLEKHDSKIGKNSLPGPEYCSKCHGGANNNKYKNVQIPSIFECDPKK